MKWIEWVIVIFLVMIGLLCLTMSATSMMNPESMRIYFDTFVRICFWLVIPIFIGLGVYLIFYKKKEGR
jgi:cadmium resistance protein CadD (predicted permease)